MLSNDLLCYSIMRNGDKAITYLAPHYAPSRHPTAPISLPPILASLTEDNLVSHNNFTTAHSLVGLQNYDFSQKLLNYRSASELSLGGSQNGSQGPSQASSPRISEAVTTASSPISEFNEKKRRQRLGPSCDSCRARKVKCNAEVVLLSRNADDAEEVKELSESSKASLYSGEIVPLEDSFSMVISNGKLVKFKPCSSCATRELECCFSKGFTKEDIVHSKRSISLSVVGERTPIASLKVKKREVASARKSSCAACRKRKVKCVMNLKVGKCIGCVKKDSECCFT